MKYQYSTLGVCSRSVKFEIDENGVLHNVEFEGGCHGNTQGLCALAEGRKALEVAQCLAGIDCKSRGTSCPDNLARAIKNALNSENN